MNGEDEHAVTVPMFYIESNWERFLSQIYGKAWVACKFKDNTGNYGKIIQEPHGENGNVSHLTATNGFSVDFFGSSALSVCYNSIHKCMFIPPLNVYSEIHKRAVISLSANETTMCVSVAFGGTEMSVWNKDCLHTPLNLKGHVGDVYKCKWFPSNVVILSASSDMTLKIWCAKTGQCPVTLIGHTRAVSDIAFVDRGRNVISVSKDGSCKLWDCGRSCCLTDLIKVSSAINCCTISVVPSHIDLPKCEVIRNEREIGTENKVLLIGCEDGNVVCIAVQSRTILFSLELAASAVNCCCTIRDGLFTVGCKNGNIFLINLEGKIVTQWLETNSSVISMSPYEEVGFFTGHMDGLCVFRSVIQPRCSLRLQLSGAHEDPIYDISYDNKYVYTACRDSLIRRYFPEPYIKKYFKV